MAGLAGSRAWRSAEFSVVGFRCLPWLVVSVEVTRTPELSGWVE
jgi:hypothetical protein